MSSTDTLVSDALKAWRFLYKRGFIEGFGHLSVRLPDQDRVLLTRHSLGPAATADDLLEMDLQGSKRSGRGDPPGEFPIHLEIYKARPDVGSVIHYHGMYSTAFTTSEQRLRPIHLLGTIFHDGIPIYPDPRLITDQRRGAALANVLGPHRAVLMRAHGAAITGTDLKETTASAFLFEENARRACVSAGLGKPLWLDERLAADAGAELIENGGAFRRVWALVESDDEERVSRA
jgi:ribulose-5-phosphate 4-epimerase/fuculose-1-phosphate aldolase